MFSFTDEQRLHTDKAFSGCHTILTTSGMGVHKELGQGTTWTADPSCESCFSGDGWTSVCPWEALDESLVLLCLQTFAFPVNSFISTGKFSHFCPLLLSPISLSQSEHLLCRAEVLSGVKPWWLSLSLMIFWSPSRP